jgi:2-polyprenyl-3-methyl-5-hydroxy-6-metoxy-1,4-benzoquinol methylase
MGKGLQSRRDHGEPSLSGSDYRSRIYADYATRFQDAKEVFDRAGSRRWGKAYDYYFRGWLPEDKGASIIDLACGGGKLLYFLRDRGYHQLQGVDISPEQVRLARQVIPEVVELDILDFLVEHRDRFDVILGLDIIEHFQKDEALRFLDGCCSALKPGGRLILQTPNGGSPWGGGIRYGDFTHEVCFTPDSITRLMQLSGFRNIEVREQGPIPWGYSAMSTARFLSWQAIRLGLKLWDVVETGNTRSGIFSRVFLASGCRK